MDAIITSTKNDLVRYARSLHAAKGRAEQGEMLVEGEKCVCELLAFLPNHLRSLIVTDGHAPDIAQTAKALGSRVYTVAEHVMAAACECKTPQGVAAIVTIPSHQPVTQGFVVALDDVQDPANVGAIIRTADAAGVSGVALSPACADAFSPKAIRASMGSAFHLPVFKTALPQYLQALAAEGHHIACAHLDGITDFTLDWQRTCLVIGNESRGISAPLMALATHTVRIPMFGKAESLNAAVAAGILIYKIRT